MARIKATPEIKHLTLDKVTRELKKIRTAVFSDYSRLLMPVTKLQRTILEALGLSTTDLTDSIF